MRHDLRPPVLDNALTLQRKLFAAGVQRRGLRLVFAVGRYARDEMSRYEVVQPPRLTASHLVFRTRTHRRYRWVITRVHASLGRRHRTFVEQARDERAPRRMGLLNRQRLLQLETARVRRAFGAWVRYMTSHVQTLGDLHRTVGAHAQTRRRRLEHLDRV